MDERELLDTKELLRRVRDGDRAAVDVLLARYLPRLRRFASGRLPARARALVDTEDMIQETLIRACSRLPAFDPRGEGALLAYLRQAVRNRIADELRKTARTPETEEVADDLPAEQESPLEATIGKEALASYERALDSLSETDREMVIARVEMGMDYASIATAVGKASPDAARMAVSRALLRLAQEMRRAGE